MKLSAILRRSPRPAIAKAVNAAKAMPIGEVLPSKDFAESVGISLSTLTAIATEPALNKFRIKIGCTVYWGNAKTIHEAR